MVESQAGQPGGGKHRQRLSAGEFRQVPSRETALPHSEVKSVRKDAAVNRRLHNPYIRHAFAAFQFAWSANSPECSART